MDTLDYFADNLSVAVRLISILAQYDIKNL